MVAGLNSEIEHNGKIFHVQTEDGGLRNPIILTRIFCGGVLVTSRKTSYVFLLDREDLKDVVGKLMKEQHQEMIQDIYKTNPQAKA